MSEIKVGDSITFRAICRWRTRPITRKVLGFTCDGDPLVNAYDCKDFIVRRHEIREVRKVNQEPLTGG